MKNQINNRVFKASFVILLSLCQLGCKKQDDWLDVKNVKSNVTPTSLNDFQAILDNNQVMNFSCPVLGLVGTDNVFFTDASVNAIAVQNRNAYLWQKDIFQGSISTDWEYPYQEIEYANIVLDGLKTRQPNAENKVEFDNIKGSALFYRAFALYNLSQLFCKPYDARTAAMDLGLPVKLSSDVNQKSVRASVPKTYDQILTDLQEASSLLPVSPLYTTRPSVAAAKFLLAKLYFDMQEYPTALGFANDVLSGNNKVLNFNNLKVAASQPFPSFQAGNPEVIFYAAAAGNSAVWPLSSTGRVDPTLYASYNGHDLRKSAFYTLDKKSGYYRFKGSYEASDYYNFAGLATNELLLLRSECLARTGKLTESLNDLNYLLKNRFDSSFVPLNIVDVPQLLQAIVSERRKELPFTGNVRWGDLRRLNLESQTANVLHRNYNSLSYQLLPNSPLYTLPIPQNEIDASGIPQNPR